MLQLNDLINPHLGKKILFSGNHINSAKSAMILIHGRGSNADSLLDLANELMLNDTVIIAPEANQFTWYPYRFIEKRERNEPGISSGLALIDSIIKSVNNNGIKTENIFLLGFSQGACLVLDYAARHPKKFGGLFALSGGLIGELISKSDYKGDLEETPVFIGCSTNDFHIPEERVHQSAEIFQNLNARVIKKLYPDMGHTVNRDELDQINSVLNSNSNN
jgi:predicted esterase